jgi:hypothetical protein
MGISKGKYSEKNLGVASYSLISPSGVEREENVDLGSHWSGAYWSYSNGKKRNGELFHVGGGNPYDTETEFVYDYGTYTLRPNNDFIARVDMWGGGGGNYHTGNSSSRAGGGGFTGGVMIFKSGVDYALTVGQAGRQGATVGTYTTNHGGGGGAGHTGPSQGGGLTGIFYNSSHRGQSAWNHNPPFNQSEALMIAGGGGGAGHHNQNSHHGSGGGGGGFTARYGHNSGGGSQYYGGYYNSYQSRDLASGRPLHGGRASTQNTWTGGGGSGWWGGGGGAHSSSHYNGGGGGSGHHAQNQTTDLFPNASLAQYIIYANTETASGYQDNPRQYSANYKTPLAYRTSSQANGEYDGLYAGKGGLGNTEISGTNARSTGRHGKIVLTMMPQLFDPQYFRDMGVSEPNGSEWVNQDGYTKN